jgi:hypothetical protein
MPYQKGDRLPGERGSKLGHLEVLKSELVNELVQRFEDPRPTLPSIAVPWQSLPVGGTPLPLVFAVDGSYHPVDSDTRPKKRLGFVKTALLRIDEYALAQVDPATPHPFRLRDILADSAMYHATVFPLRHVSVSGQRLDETVRQIIFDSMRDASLNGEPFETLKWIVYQKWDVGHRVLQTQTFACPHCEETIAVLPYDADEGACPSCGGHLYLTDLLGFHQDMSQDAASDSVATAYMVIHEVLLLFTGIRYFWEHQRALLPTCLFVKDGPLAIRAQYSKLVAPIRRFLAFAHRQGCTVHIVSQEKTGAYRDHLELIGLDGPVGHIFMPDDAYIKTHIQQRPLGTTPYGVDTNFGAKIFLKWTERQQMVLNAPTIGDTFNPNPSLADLLGIANIVATLPRLMSSRFEDGLLPIELANGIASLSTYPSAQILKIFAAAKGGKGG